MEAADMTDGDPSQAPPRWLLDMAEMLKEAPLEQASNNRRSQRQTEPDWSAFRHLLRCDHATCGAVNPPKKCSRCKSAYYCSVECQRAHWKQGRHKTTCQAIEQQHAQWLSNYTQVFVAHTMMADDDDKVASNTISDTGATCGICLENTIRHPVILPNCQHVFCFTCICSYQAAMDLTLERDSKECPYCRTKIHGHVRDEAIAKADELVKRAELMLDDSDVEGRRKLYGKAQVEVDKILEVDDSDAEALYLRAKLLEDTDALQAAKIYQDLLETIRVGMDSHQYDKVQAMQVMAHDLGRDQAAHKMSQVGDFMGQYVTGTRHLWPCQLGMARSYEAAGHYQKALAQYQSVRDSANTSDVSTYNDEELDMLSQAKFGMARSFRHLGKYKRAVGVADSLLSDERHVAGGHMLVAKALLAMSKQNTTSTLPASVITTKSGRSFSTTLLGEIQVMYQGVVYEAPWDDKNKRANRAFLKELCDKAVAVTNQNE